MPTRARALAVLCVLVLLPAKAVGARQAQAPVGYRVSFPTPEHRWMQVEVTFADVPSGPLQVRMSRSSPGRYALHEFAKNVFDVRVKDGRGRALTPARPNLHQWDVTGHDGTVVVSYRVFGDRTDGTYLSVDATHGHLNMPASLMWARGLEARAARVEFVPPPGKTWNVATQLFPTGNPLVFTAPNLQYLMDSPTEVGAFVWRTFTVDDGKGPAQTFRIALHHDGTDGEADAFAKDVETIVRETLPIFGEFPRYDGGTYTFLSDYLPWASGDGMEHRNSTVLSSSGALRNPGAAQRHPRHGGARVLPRLEHGAHPLARRRALRLRRREHVGRAVVRRGLHQLLRHASSRTAPASIRSPTRSTTWPTSSTPSRSRRAAPSAPPSR